MTTQTSPLSGKSILDIYFLENRARILEIASFLDRIARSNDSPEARADFRYKAFMSALELLVAPGERKTRAIQESLSDMSPDPIESALGLQALGAWEGGLREDH
jgi:hypothetical protein